MAKSTTKTANTEEKKDVSKLRLALDKLEKDYGVGTVITGNRKSLDMPAVSTGSIGLDAIIGIGGLPYGRVCEVVGPESCGKTTLALHIVANAQKEGKKCAYIDMEHALDANYMIALDINMEELLISQPDYGEQALEIAHMLIKSGEVGVVVIDSVASLVPKSEVDGAIGDTKMAGIGRLMSQGLRTLVPVVAVNNCLLLFTNQIRMNPGGMGNPEEPAGGKALRFYASVRLDMRRILNDKGKELSRTKIKVLKNKVGKPFSEIEIDLVWGEGFGKLGELIDIAEEYKIINRAGSWYSYGDNKIGQGREAAIQFMKDNEEFMLEVLHQVMKLLKPDISAIEEVVSKEK